MPKTETINIINKDSDSGYSVINAADKTEGMKEYKGKTTEEKDVAEAAKSDKA